MQEVQLYIDGQKIDLFKDETISLTQTIQNVKDISKVFTDFSKTFNVPASKDNNKIFKHYYNFDIVNGFDARYKIDALIKLNGFDYRKGKLRLNSVSMKNGVAYSYKVVFFGETVSLSDILGDDELDSLTDALSDFTTTLSATNTFQGLKNGWDLVGSTLTAKADSDTDTGDLIYPFISPNTLYYYDISNPTIDGNNLHTSTPLFYATDIGVKWVDLKPALKVRYILEAIETRYGLEFSEDFFVDTNQVFEQLYLWMHREKGDLTSQIATSSYEIKLAEWDLTLPDNELRTVNNTSIGEFILKEYTLNIDVNVVGTGAYSVKLINTDNTDLVYYSSSNLTGNSSISKNFIFGPYYYLNPIPLTMVVETKGGITEFNTDMNIVFEDLLEPANNDLSYYTYNGGVNVTLSSGLSIGANMPKIKVIDFLTSIFKMFNLTAYVEDSIIKVDTLDNYYDSGVERDITKFIDVSASDVERNKIYSSIGFNYEDPETLFITKSNELTNNEFGNLTYKSDEDTYDGGKYEVDVNFEKTIYERIVDDSTGVITDYSWGYFVDKDSNPTLGKPLLFYADKVTPTQTAYFNNDTTLTSIPKYMRAANVLSDESQTLNFGAEADEWTLTTNTNSLFENYYSNYINDVFNVKSRIVKLKAMLPLSFLLNYSLADVLIINGKRFKINSINTNLQTGESKLELINVV